MPIATRSAPALALNRARSGRRVHRRVGALGGADAEHGGRRPRRRHRLRRSRAGCRCASRTTTSKGLVPAPGWDARYDWAGFVDAGADAARDRPARAAGSRPPTSASTRADYPHFLTSEWALPYRQQRIEQLLQARPQHDLDSFAAMQADVKSLAAAPLLPALLQGAVGASAGWRGAARTARLRRHDGGRRAAPLIFWAWVRQLTIGVFADELGGDERICSARARGATRSRSSCSRNDACWCDDKTTPASETCAQQADAALTRALDELQQRFGAEVSKWRWGDAHQARSEHRPFSRVKSLANWFELRMPAGGDTYTVNVVARLAQARSGDRRALPRRARPELARAVRQRRPDALAGDAFGRAVGAGVVAALPRLRCALGARSNTCRCGRAARRPRR